MKFSFLLLSGMILFGTVAHSHAKPVKKAVVKKSKPRPAPTYYDGEELIDRGLRYGNTGQYAKALEVAAQLRKRGWNFEANAILENAKENRQQAATKLHATPITLFEEDGLNYARKGLFVRAQLVADRLRKLGYPGKARYVEATIRVERLKQ